MRYAIAVTFKPLATGQIQILRTGSGFWRWDHGERFSIDKPLLLRIFKNTLIRGRPLRMDFMHWANGDGSDEIAQLLKAAEVDPTWIYCASWKAPNTGTKEWGLFCPAVWTTKGANAAYGGLDEISPVIEWEYKLPFDSIDPTTGAVVPAGTFLGPTITGLSLVDQGFFWMDKVRTYSAHGARQRASLYQEYTAMILNPEQLANFLTWATGEGWEESVINAMVAAATAEAAADEEPEVAPAPDMAAAAPEASAEVMAAHASLTTACATRNPTKILAARKAYAAALSKAKKPSLARHPLADLLASATKVRSKTVARPQPQGSQTAHYSDIEEQLRAQKEITDTLMMKELEREGLLTGIDEPMELYRQAPDYFMKKVKGNVSLVGSASPVGSGRSGLRELKAVGDDEGEADHKAISAYRDQQFKAGRKLSYEQALHEWESASKKKTGAR